MEIGTSVAISDEVDALNEEQSSSAMEPPILPHPGTPLNSEVSAVPQPTQAPRKDPQKPSPKKPKKRKPKAPRDVTAPRQPHTGLYYRFRSIMMIRW